MGSFGVVLLIGLMGAVVVVLVTGIALMARGGEANRKYGNKLMTARVALQRERADAWVALYRTTGGGWTRAASLTPSSSAPSP